MQQIEISFDVQDEDMERIMKYHGMTRADVINECRMEAKDHIIQLLSEVK